MDAGRIRIGASGWNHPAGAGTWNGIFYPPAGRRQRPSRFDELAWYSEYFDTVEVNSTFYGVPKPSVTASWVRRTPPGFEFSLKLYQKFTHPRLFAAASVDRSNPAIYGHRKTGHFRRPETGVEFYFTASSERKAVWTLVRQLRGPHLSTWA